MNERIDLTPRDINGRPAYTLQQAQSALNVSYTSLQNIIRKNKIERFKLGYGLEKYVWKEDIDKLLMPRPITDDEE